MRRQDLAPKAVSPFALALAAAWVGVLVWLLCGHYAEFFWDYRTYHFAALEWLNGRDPDGAHNVPAGMKHYKELFVYPPLMVRLFAPFAWLGYPKGLFVMFALKLATFAGLVWLWARKVVADVRDSWFYLFCLLAFTSTTAIDFRCGNIVTFETALIWLGLVCFLEDRPLLFGAFIVAASLFKLTPILFLVLFFYWAGRRHFGLAALFGGLFALYLGGSYLVWPDEFARFLANVRTTFEERGLICPSTLSLARDIVRDIGGSAAASWLIDGAGALFAAFIAWFSFETTEKLRAFTPEADRRRYLVFFSCLCYALLVPRFKDYAFMVVIPPAYFMIRKLEFKSSYPVLFFLMTFLVISHTDDLVPGLDRIFFYLREYYQLWLVAGLWLAYQAFIAQRLTGKDYPLIIFRS